MFQFLYRIISIIRFTCKSWWWHIASSIAFLGNGVHFKNFRTSGIPFVMVARGGQMSIGTQFAMNNGIEGNPIGCNERCTLWVGKDAELIIGDNVGIFQTALISHCKIQIGNNVKMGGDFCIYDRLSLT